MILIVVISLACPSNVNTETDADMATAMVTWRQPIVMPNNGLLRLETQQTPGSHFPIGTTTVTYEVLEHNGVIVASCDFNISVSGK